MWEIDEDAEKMPPVHPGEILKEDFLVPMGISQYRLAKSIGVDPRRINAIVQGKRAITAETAILLGKYFGTSARLWMGLQNQYDLDVARDRLGIELSEEERIPVIEGDLQPDAPESTRSPASAATGR